MGILDFNTKDTNTSNKRQPFGNLSNVSGDRPKARLWLNVGYDKAGKFINLPIGMPIDTMEPVEPRGQNEDWIKQQNARNELLKTLQALGASFAPGQEQEIKLTIKLRRVNEELEVSKDENEYSTDLMAMLVAPAIPEAAE